MKNKIIVAALCVLPSFHVIAADSTIEGPTQPGNEAVYNPDTGRLHIPKVAVDGHYYDAEFQQTDGLNSLLKYAADSPSGSLPSISTYDSIARSLTIPSVSVGGDSYYVDMQQEHGLSFSVIKTMLLNPYFEAIDVFDLHNRYPGGNRTTSVNDTLGGGQGCGYNHIQNRVETDQKLLEMGGSVTRSTLTEWCGTLSGETACIKEFGRLLVMIEPWSHQKTITTLLMMDLIPNHWTEVEFDSLSFNYEPSTGISAVVKDSTVVDVAECSFSGLPAQSKEFINGEWFGYKATYSLITMIGTTSNARMSCVNQACTINSSSGTTLVNLKNFSLFSRSDVEPSGGSWSTTREAEKLAGATMTGDRQLLSMFVCNSPLDKAKTFENCSFFTFKR